MTTIEHLQSALSGLGLKAIEARLENLLEQAAKAEPSYADFLKDLLGCEVEARRTRYLRARLQLAHLPYVKTFDQFDFSFQPSVDERQIRELRTLRFVHEASNVIFLGPPGVGKTHLSVALAEASIQAGCGAYFITAHDLVTDLSRATRESRLDRRMRIYLAPKVLVIDEMGYLPLDEMGATIFFQLVSARYERGSIILTSNKSYGDWGSIFGDSIIATAILDRLLHHSTTVNIRGESLSIEGSAPGGPSRRARRGGESGSRLFGDSVLRCAQNAPPNTGGAGLRSGRSHRKAALRGNRGGEFYFGDLGNFQPALTKAIDLAKSGNETALRLCLERLIPPRR